ncbi:hypothetical protein [Thalassotalea piscium]|uniref:Glycosyltransferase family 2 protein n=1 Tax=Thalassotalea piscium TaxID=1230533 RepID=A0A7X0TTL0_9GAMM|nr:hypothetical protein [Thalassotalea piscium]MBB6543195.1 hypothetical protein [Thalassotalea piscium]
MKNIEKYLNHYAEPCIAALHSFPSDLRFTHSVVIPAYKEIDDFVEQFFTSILAKQNALMVLVINQPDSDCNQVPQKSLFDAVCSRGNIIWQEGFYSLVQVYGCNSSILILDSFTLPIPVKQGVGLARKQGVDTALALIADKIILSEWICSTDADASLPDEYFNALSTLCINTVGACYHFYHQCEHTETHQANALYERALHYYVAGLNYAGSSYNFYTIGSILAFTANAYANVRGFPKRSAGEDFYLLNKLAKLGDITYLKEHTIKLTARRSDRVPFGTGPAVNHIIELQRQQLDYCYYHPQVFVLLKEVIVSFSSLYAYRNDLNKWLDNLSIEAKEGLLALGFERFISKQNTQNNTNAASNRQFNKQLNVWFDAFITLKFIHFIRNDYWPDIPLNEAIDKAPF